MNFLNNYNYIPTTVNGDQFLAYKQSGIYMTDYRSNADLYSYLIKQGVNNGVMTSHQLRQYLQDNSETYMNNFRMTTQNQFINMKIPGAPNTCSDTPESVIINGGKPMVNDNGVYQMLEGDNCPNTCTTQWLNTPIPQQSRYCS